MSGTNNPPQSQSTIDSEEQGASEKPQSGNKPATKQVANLSAELTFEQQQVLTEILESYRSNPSNSNKYRYHLFAQIDEYLAQEANKARLDELGKLSSYNLARYFEIPIQDINSNPHWRGEYIQNRIQALTADKESADG